MRIKLDFLETILNSVGYEVPVNMWFLLVHTLFGVIALFTIREELRLPVAKEEVTEKSTKGVAGETAEEVTPAKPEPENEQPQDDRPQTE